jgi:uncharacterized protein
MSLQTTTQKLIEIARSAMAADSAHDFSHCLRVLANAKKIASTEGGDLEVLTAAAFLHDIANLPKNHPESHLSSERSAERAEQILRDLGLPTFDNEKLVRMKDAILCHSYSRGLTPQTLEGRIFQDADRLDGIGAIGIARTFTVGGATHRPLYADEDPFLDNGRTPNDKENTLDHFFVKLFKLSEKMQTETGRRIALERTKRMKRFVDELREEIC